MKTLKTALQNKKTKLALSGSVVVASLGASSAFAVSAAETAITTAIASGTSLMELVAPGVIGIAAIMLGVGLAVSWIRK